MEKKKILNAQYLKQQDVKQVDGKNVYVNIGENIAITANINGKTLDYIPLDPDNVEYAEIMRQVDAGDLEIEPADEE